MISLANKAKQLAPLLRQKGKLYLLALVERGDTPKKWDLVLSADWSNQEAKLATQFIASKLMPTLISEERQMLSRIVVLNSSEPFVKVLTQAMEVTDSDVTIKDSNFYGIHIKHVILFESHRPT